MYRERLEQDMEKALGQWEVQESSSIDQELKLLFKS